MISLFLIMGFSQGTDQNIELFTRLSMMCALNDCDSVIFLTSLTQLDTLTFLYQSYKAATSSG